MAFIAICFIFNRSCPWKPVPCSWDNYRTTTPNPHILEGALISGPGALNGSFTDQRTLAECNVATDYNAGFASALAGKIPYMLQSRLHTRDIF